MFCLPQMQLGPCDVSPQGPGIDSRLSVTLWRYGARAGPAGRARTDIGAWHPGVGAARGAGADVGGRDACARVAANAYATGSDAGIRASTHAHISACADASIGTDASICTDADAHVRTDARLSVVRLAIHRLPVIRLPITRLTVVRLAVHRLPIRRLAVVGLVAIGLPAVLNEAVPVAGVASLRRQADGERADREDTAQNEMTH